MYQSFDQNKSGASEQTPPDLTVMFDLNQNQMTALLEQCRKEQRPVQDVCRSAIANYLQQKDLQAFNLAKALAD